MMFLRYKVTYRTEGLYICNDLRTSIYINAFKCGVVLGNLYFRMPLRGTLLFF